VSDSLQSLVGPSHTLYTVKARNPRPRWPRNEVHPAVSHSSGPQQDKNVMDHLTAAEVRLTASRRRVHTAIVHVT